MKLRTTIVLLLAEITVGGCANDALPGEATEHDFLIASADDEPRRDLYEAEIPNARRFASADLFSSWRDDLLRRRDGDFELLSDPFTTIAEPPPEVPLCADASFYGQPRMFTGASNVLVGEDLVLTAWHTMPNAEVCAARALIVDHALAEPTDPTHAHPVIPRDRVYYCAEIVASGLPGADPDPTNDGDWTLYRLDRAVDAGRRPIPLRRRGAALLLADASIAGHPHRLPLKLELGTVSTGAQWIAGQGHVTPGSSGSMVVETRSGRLVGVVTTGGVQRVLDPVLGCYRECVAEGCPETYGGASAELALDAVPPIGLDVAPADAIVHYGPPGGPFTERSVVYRLEAGAAGRALDINVNVETSGADLLVASADDFALAPGTAQRLGVSLGEEVVALPVGEHDANVELVEHAYVTTDVRPHRVSVGVEGFTVASAPALHTLAYAVSNRYLVAQDIEVRVDVPWLLLDGGAQELALSLPPIASITFTVERDESVPAPPAGTEATIDVQSAWHVEERHVLWDGARLVALD